jgi:hypothetical protein
VDSAAFVPGTPEVELSVVKFASVLGLEDRRVKGATGWATLTNDRIVFDETKWNAGAGGAVGGVIAMHIAKRLQDRHAEKRGPLLQLPVADIRAASHSVYRLNRDVLDLTLADGTECRLGTCFKKWSPLLQQLLPQRHGLTIIQTGPRAWRAEPNS